VAGRSLALLVTALALVAGACTSDTAVSQGESRPAGTGDPAVDTTVDEGADTTAPRPPVTTVGGEYVPQPLEWEPLRDGVEVALFDVPFDYDDPDAGSFELFIALRPASDPDRRIGTLLVNPGGPGFGGSNFAIFANQIFDRELLRHFDIVGWDPRGTGESDPAIDCIDDFDRYFASLDTSPDPVADNIALAEEFAEECKRNNADIVSLVGTNNSARDIDSIRRALGEDTITYFGFSYGSELGATWATLFPDTVRAAVFDGAADPGADSLESSLQQLTGFEASLATFLARCSATSRCAFHNGGDAEGAYDRLMERLAADPIASDPGRPRVGRNIATNGVIQAMYSELFWPQLEQALAAAEFGDGSGLLALHDSYFQRAPDGTHGDELEAFQTISCADDPERLTVEEVDAQLPLFTAVAPRLVPEGSLSSYFCTFFPPSIDPRIEINGAGAGPLVAIGTTGDPATPLDSTRRMVEALEDGRLVVVVADQHTGYNVNRCINELVNSYLVDLEPPADGTRCE
jgi:pimeloyl-ACP methyl ester carboxylesterase